VINADYVRLERPDTALARMVNAVRNGGANYRLAIRARTPIPWPWLPAAHPDLTGDRLEPVVTSYLRNINPTIEVFERR
jgi:hypothetical protein